LKQRTEQTPHALKIIRDFIVERTAADEHYSEQLISLAQNTVDSLKIVLNFVNFLHHLPR